MPGSVLKFDVCIFYGFDRVRDKVPMNRRKVRCVRDTVPPSLLPMPPTHFPIFEIRAPGVYCPPPPSSNSNERFLRPVCPDCRHWCFLRSFWFDYNNMDFKKTSFCTCVFCTSLFPHLHTPFPPFSPSLISLMVSVHVKHHAYFYS